MRFRRAVSHAVDRGTIASNVWLGLATPLHGFITPGNRAWVATDLPRYEYDLEKARALLREAGFQTRGTAEAPELYDAKGARVAFTILAPAGTKTRVDSAAVVQEDLRKLGGTCGRAVETRRQRTPQPAYDYEAVFSARPSPTRPFVLRPVSAATARCTCVTRSRRPRDRRERRLEFDGRAGARDDPAAAQLFREIQLILAEPCCCPRRSSTSPPPPTRASATPPSPPPLSLWNAEALFAGIKKGKGKGKG